MSTLSCTCFHRISVRVQVAHAQTLKQGSYWSYPSQPSALIRDCKVVFPGVALSPEVPEIGMHMNASLRVHKHSIQSLKGYLAHKETANPPGTTIRP